jgi:hypothetical protein
LKVGFNLGITPVEAALDAELPTAFVASTENVYVESLVRPVTVQLVVAIAVQDAPPGLAVAVYEVTAEPPELSGAVHETVD